MKRYINPKGTLVFVVIAVVLMVLLDVFVLNPHRYTPNPKRIIDSSVFTNIGSEVEDFETAHSVQKRMQVPKGLETNIPLRSAPAAPPAAAIEKTPETIPNTPQEKMVIHEPPPGNKPRIAIIIDDMGLSHERAVEVMKLPKPLTLAFLPYAPHLDKTTREAKSYGHELMIHVPMEPLNEKLDPGPHVLRTDMNKEQLEKALDDSFNSFSGYSGINNHMGSKLTQDKEALEIVMEELKKRHLFFIDSKTFHSSVAAAVARDSGIPYNERDVFLDHEPTHEFAVKALSHTEEIARQRGYAIAIGHPKPETIKALKEWIPTLKKKGIELVPVSTLLKKPEVQKAQAKMANVPDGAPIQ